METLLDKIKFAYPSVTGNLKRGTESSSETMNKPGTRLPRRMCSGPNIVFQRSEKNVSILSLSKNSLRGLHC